jgi:SAM-dependent methyltransferase
MALYVQYGCAWSSPDGWLNFDASPTVRFERLPLIGKLYTKNETRFPANVLYGDIVRGLPVGDNSCDGVYSSHVLEHLTRADVEKALAETYRILKPGCIFRVIVPDLENYARNYLEAVAEGDKNAADNFMRRSHLGVENRSRSPFALLQDWLGNRRHLWMWDYPSLTERLAAHGFCSIRRATFGDSADSAFAAVEDAIRFEDAVAIEAKK